MSNGTLHQLAEHIELLILDVDGVLTDGLLYYDEQGNESKCFSVRDGLGLRLLQEAGVEVGVITGRESVSVGSRMRELGIEILFQKVRNKRRVLEQLLEQKQLSWDKVAYMGDDLNDLPCLKLVGLPMAPSNAVSEVKEIALFIAEGPGGNGAVREACELIAKAKGRWLELADSFFNQ